MNKLILIVFVVTLYACTDSSKPLQKPTPLALGDDEIGYYMQMIVADHAGPKAQLWLSDQRKPIWFVDVRDAILFKRTPEEADNITVIYGHDMAKNPDYNNVKDIWVDLEKAFYVIDSQCKGGMGMPETIPFSDLASAEKFAVEHGGQVIKKMTEIPTKYLTEMPDMSGADPSGFMKGHHH